MKSIAVTPAGPFQVPFIKHLITEGFYVITIDEDKNAPGHKYGNLAIVENLENFEKIIEIIEQGGLKPSGAISYCSDVGILLACLIRKHFGLPSESIETSENMVRKDLQRKAWGPRNNQTPEFVLISNNAFDLTIIGQVFKNDLLVIKPVDLAGSKGVEIVSAGSGQIQKHILKGLEMSKIGKVIVEEFMQGDEFTIDGFITKGQARTLLMTRKYKLIPGLPTVANVLEALDINSNVVARGQKFVQESLLALGYKDGPFHCELIMKDGEVVGMVEVAGRGGGSNLANRLIPIHSGINYFELSALYAVGDDTSWNRHLNQPCLMLFIPSKEGTFRSFRIPEQYSQLAVEGRLSSEMYVREGEVTASPKNDGNRVGDVIIIGQSFEGWQKFIRELNLDDWVSFENK
jgi:biotin carboxylase